MNTNNSNNNKSFDVTIIGGGLHGAAIAADCAGRGLRTLLCDQDDVGGSHNVVSNRLFHCGLQYLQRGDISRVTDSVHERSLLMKRAPHLAQPTTVVIPQQPGLTSRLKTNTTAFLYKLVAGHSSQLEATNIANKNIAEPLKPLPQVFNNRPAIQFQDVLINDARLAVEHLIMAKSKGTTILPYTALKSAIRKDGKWLLSLHDEYVDYSTLIESTCVINAAGPSANQVQKSILNIQSRCSASNYLAGYIVTPKLFEGSQTYLLEHEDKHLIAAIPYLEQYSLVGPFIYEEDVNDKENGLPDDACEALINITNAHFKKQISQDDVVHRFSVLTSSYKETPEAIPTPFSQDYVLDFNCSDGKSPCISLFGACLNMHRQIAEQAIEQMMPYLPKRTDVHRPWTAHEPLPGGNFADISKEHFLLQMADQFTWLPSVLLQRYIDLYGSRCQDLLEGCSSMADLGQPLASGLYEREANWLCEEEWVRDSHALIWHRTKLGLSLNSEDISLVNQWFETHYHYRSPLVDLHTHTQINREAS